MKAILCALLLGTSFVIWGILDIRPQAASPTQNYLVYVGTAVYTGQPSKAIYVFRFDSGTGHLTALGLAAESENPGFLAVHPNQRVLYAVKEIGDAKAQSGGAVSTFSIDPKTGKLAHLNEVPSHGAHPCHLTVDRTGRYVLAANYFGGTIEAFPVKDDGRLGEACSVAQHTGTGRDPERQEAPHPHFVEMSPDNRFAIAADLGTDKLVVHRFDTKDGSLTPNSPPSANVSPGAGPRHFTFGPGGKFLYALNELESSVTAFSYNGSAGILRSIQTVSMLPRDFKSPNSGAEVAVAPSGRFLYASNRGHDSIAVFSIDATKGTLRLIEHVPTGGKTPRNFAIDPTGSYLIVANQDSDSLVVFRIDSKTGSLTPTNQMLKAIAPVCVVFARLGTAASTEVP